MPQLKWSTVIFNLASKIIASLSSECSLQAGSSAQDPAGGEHGSAEPVLRPDDNRTVLRPHGIASR